MGHVFLSLGRRGQVIHVVLSYFKAVKSRILNHVEVSPVKAGKVGMARITS